MVKDIITLFQKLIFFLNSIDYYLNKWIAILKNTGLLSLLHQVKEKEFLLQIIMNKFLQN